MPDVITRRTRDSGQKHRCFRLIQFGKCSRDRRLHERPFRAAVKICGCSNCFQIGAKFPGFLDRPRQCDLRIARRDRQPRAPLQGADSGAQGADSGGGVAVAGLAATPAKANQANEMRRLRFAFFHAPSPSPSADTGRTSRSTVMW